MIKRGFDIVLASIGLILTIPLFLGISFLIGLFMPGPVIFRQKRTGRHGVLFTVYKFRTMIVNHSGNTMSIKGDSRITSLGARLRKYKLDELPELWNILIGDMSFVGPRPDVPEYIDRLNGEQRIILDLLPGLTSPASIKYAREEELLASFSDPQKYYDEVIWPDKVRLNLEYYKNRSFYGDLIIIVRTLLSDKFRINNTTNHATDLLQNKGFK